MFSYIRAKHLHRAAAAGNLETIISLVEGGTDVNAPSFLDGVTALHLSARHGAFKASEFLILSGADVNAREKASETPLHWAAARGHADVARLLLQSGASPGSRAGAFGETPLHEAAWGGHCAAAAVLLENGASAGMKDWSGRTPLHWACSGKGHPGTVKLLLKKDGGPDASGGTLEETPLHSAARTDNHRAAGILLAAGADPGARDKDGRTPLETAVKFGSSMTAAVLRKKI